MSHPRFAFVCAPLVAALLLVGCGDDDESESTTTTTAAAAPDVERYCELVTELEAAGDEIFGALEQDGSATPEDFQQAELELLEENEALFDELQEVAPDEIQADVETLVAGLRVRAGLEEGTSPGDVGAAEKRVREYEKQNCG